MDSVFVIRITPVQQMSFSKGKKMLESWYKDVYSDLFSSIHKTFKGNFTTEIHPDLSLLSQEIGGEDHAVLALKFRYSDCEPMPIIRLHNWFENLAHIINIAPDVEVEFSYQTLATPEL